MGDENAPEIPALSAAAADHAASPAGPEAPAHSAPLRSIEKRSSKRQSLMVLRASETRKLWMSMLGNQQPSAESSSVRTDGGAVPEDGVHCRSGLDGPVMAAAAAPDETLPDLKVAGMEVAPAVAKSAVAGEVAAASAYAGRGAADVENLPAAEAAACEPSPNASASPTSSEDALCGMRAVLVQVKQGAPFLKVPVSVDWTVRELREHLQR